MNIRETIAYIIANFSGQLKDPSPAFRQLFIGLAGIALFLLLGIIALIAFPGRRKALKKKIDSEYEE